MFLKAPQAYYLYCLPKAKSKGAEANPYKYGGKELTTELGNAFYDFEARVQLPTIGLFSRPDPKAGDFSWLNTYSYCGADPVNNTDPTGMEIDMSKLIMFEENNRVTVSQSVIKDLIKQSGLTLKLDENNRLQYQKDEKGNAVVATTTDKEGNTVNAGSKTARELLIKVIDSNDVIPVWYGNKSRGGEEGISLSDKQINGFINGAINIDGNTMVFGMTFLHELLHTPAGGGYKDSHETYGTGGVVDKMNEIRNELNQQNFNYGQRCNYKGILTDDNYIITPFDNSALFKLKEGYDMGPRNKYIKYKK